MDTDDKQKITELYDNIFILLKTGLIDGRSPPPQTIFTIRRSTDQVEIAIAPPNLDKNALAQAHQDRANDPDTICSILVMEGWTVEAKDRDEAEAMQNQSLANHPDRKTCFVFSFMTPLRQGFAHTVLPDDPNNLEQPEIKWLDELPEGVSVAGRFVRDDQNQPRH